MRLLCLNLWGGRRGQELLDYLAEQALTTDIFCFQEVFDSRAEIRDYDKACVHLFEELQLVLPDFIGYFAGGYDGWVDMEPVDFPITEGQALFVRKRFTVTNNGSIYIYGNKQTIIAENFTNEPKILQYGQLAVGNRDLLIANVHGKWHPGDKTDTPDRLEQSAKIKTFLQKFSGPKILCGDFNLDLNTQSIATFEPEMASLIKQYNIKNTRNEISWANYNNKQYFADFMFTSPDIKVKNFEAPYVLVSDHLPMMLDFKIA